MTRHAAHDALFPFLLWHSRCQDASVMAAHAGLRTVCSRLPQSAAAMLQGSFHCSIAVASALPFVDSARLFDTEDWILCTNGGDAAPPFLSFLSFCCLFFLSHQLMQSLSCPKPLTAIGTNLQVRSTKYIRILLALLPYIRSACILKLSVSHVPFASFFFLTLLHRLLPSL